MWQENSALGQNCGHSSGKFIALDYITPHEIVHSAQIAWDLHHVRLVLAAKGVFWVAEAAAGLAQAAQWVAAAPERVAERAPGVECSLHRRRGEDQHQKWPRQEPDGDRSHVKWYQLSHINKSFPSFDNCLSCRLFSAQHLHFYYQREYWGLNF